MLTPSPTVTHSPTMMGGVNVAAIAIPVVLVLLLLLVIGVVMVGVGYYYHVCNYKRQGLSKNIISSSINCYDYSLIVIVQVFSQEVSVNKWKIVYITCWKTDHHSVCTHAVL